MHYDRPIKTHNYRTAVTVGARTVQDTLGYTGAGIGVAVIDSGITSWHDDLTNMTSKLFPYGNQRVAKFVDFVNGRTLPYDDNGHGSARRRHHRRQRQRLAAARRPASRPARRSSR